MRTAVSADGTAIAFDRFGDGPPIIMVVGAFNDRSTTEPLARALEQRFTVLNYDRRGRGDSGDTAPYSIDREIEDLDALIVAGRPVRAGRALAPLRNLLPSPATPAGCRCPSAG